MKKPHFFLGSPLIFFSWKSALQFFFILYWSAGRNVNNLRYADDTTFTAENEEELKGLLMKMKDSEKVGIKLNIQKTKIFVTFSQ